MEIRVSGLVRLGAAEPGPKPAAPLLRRAASPYCGGSPSAVCGAACERRSRGGAPARRIPRPLAGRIVASGQPSCSTIADPLRLVWTRPFAGIPPHERGIPERGASHANSRSAAPLHGATREVMAGSSGLLPFRCIERAGYKNRGLPRGATPRGHVDPGKRLRAACCPVGRANVPKIAR